jgi:hypothetical protein
LSDTIKDYSVNLYYEQTGIIDKFKQFVMNVMQGTYFQEETTDGFCRATTPQDLAL